jgi:peptidoglycan-associated lipoprotein
MRKKFWYVLALFLVIPGLMFMASCAKKTVATQEEMQAEETSGESTEVVVEEETVEEDVAQTPDFSEVEAEQAARQAEQAKMMFLGEYVHFAFDRSDLDDVAQEVLRRKAAYMRDYPDSYITIEGHCDDRGTNEYNLALGDRRAESAKAFVVDLGIEAYRISTVSYGEERPLCYEQNEECWAKNRRAAFVIN